LGLSKDALCLENTWQAIFYCCTKTILIDF